MAKDDKGGEYDRTRQGGDQMSEAEIDYNVMGSFPASDPPSWTLGVRPRKTSRDEFEGEKPSPHDPSHLDRAEQVAAVNGGSALQWVEQVVGVVLMPYDFKV